MAETVLAVAALVVALAMLPAAVLGTTHVVLSPLYVFMGLFTNAIVASACRHLARFPEMSKQLIIEACLVVCG